jgi:hypothetical protein
MQTDLTQKGLVAELAVAISQFMQVALPHDTDKDGFVFHSYQAPFDQNCYILAELGVAYCILNSPPAELVQAGRGVGPSAFKFISPSETRSIIMDIELINSSVVFRLLESYIRSMEDYGWLGSHLSVGREPFEPAPIFIPQIDALVECGYLTRVGTMIIWTDLVAPVMQSAGFWDASLSIPLRPIINLPIEARADVERLIAGDQYIAAVSAVSKIANVEIAEAKAYLDELRKLKSFH